MAGGGWWVGGGKVLTHLGSMFGRAFSFFSNTAALQCGVVCGRPQECRPDARTGRARYTGPVINRTARFCGMASGGQVSSSPLPLANANAFWSFDLAHEWVVVVRWS